MHDDIKRFPLTGEMKDGNIVEAKERHILFVESLMRDEGHVPALDLEPQFTLDYNKDTETYGFRLSVYGIYVGVDEAWHAAGVMGGKMIMRSTPQVK